MRRLTPYFGLGAVLLFGIASLVEAFLNAPDRAPRASTVRVGFFPNLTHGPVLLGVEGEDHLYADAAGPATRVEGVLFDSGPLLVQALFAGEIDLGAVGPNPAVNGFVRSRGEALSVVAGCASGGAGLVLRGRDLRIERDGDGRPLAIVGPEGRLTIPAFFAGRALATPSVANTQDLAARAWLSAIGLAPKERGGTVTMLPVSNAEQLTLFKKGELDASWAPEPWLSRLVHEGGGTLLLDERDLWPGRRMATTLLAAHPRFLREHPDLARRLLRAHARIVDWIGKRPDEARERIAGVIRRLTRKTLPPEVLRDAFARVAFTTDPMPETVEVMARRAFDAGFLGETMPNLKKAYDLSFLRDAGPEQGKP